MIILNKKIGRLQLDVDGPYTTTAHGPKIWYWWKPLSFSLLNLKKLNHIPGISQYWRLWVYSAKGAICIDVSFK